MIKKMSLMAIIFAISLVTVNAATVSGVVSDTSEKPITNTSVTLSAIGGGGNTYTDMTDATGNCRLAALAWGAYSLNATKAGI